MRGGDNKMLEHIVAGVGASSSVKQSMLKLSVGVNAVQ